MGCGCSKTVKRNTVKQVSKTALLSKSKVTYKTASNGTTKRRVIKRPNR